MGIRSVLEKKFFPFVVKPGRYAGGEEGQVVKDPADRVCYLHAFPDKYELGQSYLGLQTLYHVLNSDDRFVCERAFAVDNDAEEILRRENLPLFSLETSRPAREFDAVGFTVTYELIFTNILAMLDLAGIPLRSSDRTDDDPIIMAGGPAVFNPEPMAEFIDLFFIGDAEEGLPEMLAVIAETKELPRAEKLRALSKVSAVYIPSLYDADGNPIGDAPEEIHARLLPQLKAEYYPEQPIVPLIETVHAHLGIEIMRGCPQGCRFCQAGPIYRPIRVRPQNEIMRQIETQVAASGFDEIALVSLSSSDYPDIENLAGNAARRLKNSRVSISLSSLKPGTISPELLEAVSTVRKSGLTLAPEAGSERLRLFIRKDFPDEAVYDTARIAFSKGWTTIKLYFMVGLPTETDEDLLGIVNIIRNVYDIGCEYPGRKTINVTLSPFVPKPHTPFQWDSMDAPEELLRKVQFIRRNNRIKAVNFKYHTIESAILAGILGRGDRRLADAIEAVFKRGCRFDGWSEDFKPDVWFEELKNAGVDIEAGRGAIPFSRRLPWAHIRKGQSVEHLQQERQRTSAQLKEFVPRFQDPAKAEGAPTPQYGRTRKKVPTRDTGAAPTKNLLRIRWGKVDRFRYMSHLDNIRLIERVIRKAKLPVAYSQGFNPSMKLSFGPPLPLGFTSESEFADITFESNLLPYMVEKLKESMPLGFDILDARVVFGKKKSLSAQLNRVDYKLSYRWLEDTQDLPSKIEQLLARESIEVERLRKEETKTLDIRPAIYDLSIEEEVVYMCLGIGEGGYAKPSEVVAALTGLPEATLAGMPFHRKNMYHIDSEGERVEALEL